MGQEEEEVRLPGQHLPGRLQDAELVLELRAQMIDATAWAPQVRPQALPSSVVPKKGVGVVNPFKPFQRLNPKPTEFSAFLTIRGQKASKLCEKRISEPGRDMAFVL